ncbi:hypothetical protein DPMN_136954 [Dreissena polymorpha]|uniref:Uncharacterized protein n=1 Tax=Dreissena polymorpha TaxID=45954 RepID=A0A9D4JIC7_DREPO|nr:hypothetical protein DPMN_136954 [Dreissena polymorpha]
MSARLERQESRHQTTTGGHIKPRPVDTAQTKTTHISAIRSHHVTDTVRVLGIHRPEKTISWSTRTTEVVTTETVTNPFTVTTTTRIRCHAGFGTRTDSVGMKQPITTKFVKAVYHT